MKYFLVENTPPSKLHIRLAQQHGDDSLGANMVADFLAGAPMPAGYKKSDGDRGTLIKRTNSVKPHSDTWVGDMFAGPREQRSLFWVLSGQVYFKVDGYKAIPMWAGEWVVFDHRKEHMVIADRKWLGAAWQLQAI